MKAATNVINITPTNRFEDGFQSMAKMYRHPISKKKKLYNPTYIVVLISFYSTYIRDVTNLWNSFSIIEF